MLYLFIWRHWFNNDQYTVYVIGPTLNLAVSKLRSDVNERYGDGTLPTHNSLVRADMEVILSREPDEIIPLNPDTLWTEIQCNIH